MQSIIYILWRRSVSGNNHEGNGMLSSDRLIAKWTEPVWLSAEIYSISKACQTSLDGRIPDDPPNGGGITEGQIEELTNIWSKLSFDEIENRMSQLDDHNSSCFQ